MQRDELYLRDIMAAADDTREFVTGLRYEQFLSDKIAQSAILYNLVVIGEAANKLSSELRKTYQKTRWSKVVGYRHFVAPEHLATDLDMVWDAATVDLPHLRDQVARILDTEFHSSDISQRLKRSTIDVHHNIDVPASELEEICARYQVRELALFGSVMGSDFRNDSDLDVLVEFKPAVRGGLFDLFDLRRELEAIFGRTVDIGEKARLKPLIRDDVLDNAEVIYAAERPYDCGRL